MTRLKPAGFLSLLVLAVFSMSSCSGKKGGTICTSNCGGGNGTGTVIVTITATPSQTFYFPFLAWDILGLDLITSTGTDQPILSAPLSPLDFARLQSDSQFLNLNQHSVTVAAAGYTSARIQLKPSGGPNPSYFYNSTNAALLGCAAGAVCTIPSTVAGFSATTVTVPVNFTVAQNQNTGFSLNFDLSKAVTTAGGMTFDFTKTGAITLAKLPRTGQPSGSLDSLQNFTGIVDATSSTTIHVFSISSDGWTFTMASNAKFDDPFSVCSGTANFQCLALNQNVSVDAVVNSDGTFTAYEVEFLDKSALETEGVIVTPVSNNQFQMVVTNGMPVSAAFFPGTLVTVNLSSTSTYSVDPKNLLSTTPTTGFQSSGDLVVGQDVMLQGGTQGTSSLSGYTRTLLRYSTISGTVQSPSGTTFTLSGLSPFFASSTTNNVAVQTFANTTYDNITDFSGLVSGTTNASVRGLYLNPNSGATQPLLAARVRAH